jgi:inner membrane protein
MLIKTHLSATFLLILFFIGKIGGVENKVLFFLVAMVSTYLPDIDSKTSKLGKNVLLRPVQWFTGHRKFFHSFTFLAIIFVFYQFFTFENIFYGFLLGYSSHLIMDCLTVRGIYPFYPFKLRISGFIKTGSVVEKILMWCLLTACLFKLGVSIFIV